MPRKPIHSKEDEGTAIIVQASTRNVLNLTNQPDLRNALTNAANVFITLPWSEATRILCSALYHCNSPSTFCYNKAQKELNKIGFTLRTEAEPNSKLYSITAEQARHIADELVYQMCKKHKGFLSLSITPGCEEEHNALCRAVHNEPVLLFLVYQAINWNKRQPEEKVFQVYHLLVSENAEERTDGINKFQTMPFYALPMTPYSKHIGELLMATYKQQKAVKSQVGQPRQKRQPTHVDKVTTAVEIPSDLLTAVPDLKDIAAYIKHQEEIRCFIQANTSGLNSLKDLRSLKMDLLIFFNADPKVRSRVTDVQFTTSFKRDLQQIATQTCGKTVDINEFVDMLRVFDWLLPVYNSLRTAYDAKVLAEKAFTEHLQKVCSNTSATPEALTDSEQNTTNIRTCLEKEAAYQERVKHFQGVFDKHIRPIVHRV